MQILRAKFPNRELLEKTSVESDLDGRLPSVLDDEHAPMLFEGESSGRSGQRHSDGAAMEFEKMVSDRASNFDQGKSQNAIK